MQCREVSRRLNNKEPLSQELQMHINSCESCRRLVEAERQLVSALDSARSSETPITPYSVLRSQIALKAQRKDNPLMAGIKNAIGTHPRLSIGTLLAVCVLAFVVLVPLPYNRTVGFDLKISGLPQSFSDQAFSDGLKALGYKNPQININASPAGISLTVKNLPSKSAAREIEMLVADGTDQNLKVEIIPIVETVSGSLYAQARQKMVEIEVDGTGKTDEQIKAEIKAKLAEQGIDNGIVYFRTDSDSTRHIEMKLNIEENGPDSMHHGLTHDIEIQTDGKTDAEIEAEVKARLEAQGQRNPKVTITTDSNGQRKIEIEVQDTSGGQ